MFWNVLVEFILFEINVGYVLINLNDKFMVFFDLRGFMDCVKWLFLLYINYILFMLFIIEFFVYKNLVNFIEFNVIF